MVYKQCNPSRTLSDCLCDADRYLHPDMITFPHPPFPPFPVPHPRTPLALPDGLLPSPLPVRHHLPRPLDPDPIQPPRLPRLLPRGARHPRIEVAECRARCEQAFLVGCEDGWAGMGCRWRGEGGRSDEGVGERAEGRQFGFVGCIGIGEDEE